MVANGVAKNDEGIVVPGIGCGGMEVQEAVYALVVHWYAEQSCPNRKERITTLAADKIRDIAIVLQIPPKRSAAQLGFDFERAPVWPIDAVRIARMCVKRGDAEHLVRRLQSALDGLTVADLESYAEAVR